MKKVLLLAGLMMGLNAFGQKVKDPVIMKINGKSITKKEFEYSFNKNNSDGVIDKKTVEEYVPLFVDFKLKVAEAESQKIDTITSVRKELVGYKEQMVLPTVVDTVFIEKVARDTYENTAKQFGGQDLLTASHILLMLRQDATSTEDAACKARIDSIYNALKAVPTDQLASKFAEMAMQLSDDKGSAQRGGALGQFGKGMMIPDFENAAYALKAGQMSAPVKSTVGYHIIYMTERHAFEPYDFHRANILRFLEQRGVREASANAYIDSVAKLKNLSRDVVVDDLHKKLIEGDEELRFLSQEYYDGTLMYEVTKKDVWDVAQKDTEGLEKYFNAHRSSYAWDAPRFIGVIVHAKDASVIEKAKQILANLSEDEYAKALADELNNDSVRQVRIERGLFKKGDNANVDKLAFQQETELKPMKDYPVTEVFGQMYTNPRSYKDVKGQVTTDYQNECERAWVEKLRKKFDVKVDQKVVDKVNK